MDDEKDVQQEQTSETEVASTTGGAEQTTETPPETLTEERITQIVEQRLSQERERIKQSSRDIARTEVAEAQNKQRLAETQLTNVKTQLGSYNPEDGGDINQAIKQAELESQNQFYQTQEQQRAVERQNLEAYNRFKGGLSGYAESQGVDPNGIDWKDDTSETLFDKNERVLSEIGKAQTSVRKKAEDDMKQEFADLERKLRIDLGMETQAKEGAGVAPDDEAKFIEEYNDGLRDTPADHKRAKEILNKT